MSVGDSTFRRPHGGKPMKRLLALFALTFSFCVVGALAQQKRAMTFEDVLALKSVSDAQVSPDGKWVAYVVTSVDMKENANDADVWLVSTSGGEPIRLTTNKKNDNQPRWIAKGVADPDKLGQAGWSYGGYMT